MKKAIIVALLSCLLTSGCQSITVGGDGERMAPIREPTAKLVVVGNDAEFEQLESGKRYTSLSDSFDFTVHPVKIHIYSNGDESILHRYEVHNKTDEHFPDFEVIMRLDPRMEKYYGTGVVSEHFPDHVEFVSRSRAEISNGISDFGGALQHELTNDAQRKRISFDQDELDEWVKTIQIQVEWSGGGEYYEFSAQVDKQVE